MPHSVFAPYTSITTNILFFDKTKPTKEIWFYRLDMPENYKNFSKTKPMKLEHFEDAIKWWKNREEINLDGFDKAKKYSIDEIISLNYNIKFIFFAIIFNIFLKRIAMNNIWIVDIMQK